MINISKMVLCQKVFSVSKDDYGIYESSTVGINIDDEHYGGPLICERTDHHDLQRYMCRVNKHDIINDILVLNKDLLYYLQFEVKNKLLPTSLVSMFYTKSSDLYYDKDIKFCETALKEIKKGNIIVYHCE
jgi:hypothetical protein